MLRDLSSNVRIVDNQVSVETQVQPPAAESEELHPPAARPASNTQDMPILLASLALGIYWAVGTANFKNVQPGSVALLALGVVIGTAVVSRWRGAGWAVLLFTVAIGLGARVGRTPFVGSDVMAATREGVAALERGENPYTHHYLTTNPSGSPFPYLPGEIAFYAIPRALTGDVAGADKWTGMGIVILLATLALAVGPAPAALATALYGTFEPAILRSLDGSNDTSLAFLAMLAIALLAWSERAHRFRFLLFYASAVAFGWALLFKPLAWLLYPPVAAYLRRRRALWRSYVSVSLGLAVLVTLPFFLAAPAPFVRNIAAGLSFHQHVSGLNLWSALASVQPQMIAALTPIMPVLDVLAIALAALLAVLRPAPSLGRALWQSLLVTFVALFLARYSTGSYYAFAAAILAAALALTPFTAGEGTDG